MIISRTRSGLLAMVSAIVLGLLLAPSAQALDLKIATIAPEGTVWMKQMRDGSKEIKERTDGRVNFKFFGGGVMGNDKKVMRKIRIGQLQGAAGDQHAKIHRTEASGELHRVGLVAITQLNRFTTAGGCTRRHRRAAHGAGAKNDIGFHSRVATGINNFTAANIGNKAHQ